MNKLIIVRNLFGILFMIVLPIATYFSQGLVAAMIMFSALCLIVTFIMTLYINGVDL